MSGKEISKEALAELESWLKSDTYLSNIAFWQKAWSGVKTPYTQMPDLPYLAQIPEKLKAGDVKSVLDLGCGSGWLSIYLARCGFSVTGTDLSDHALDLAKQWAQQENLSPSFVPADIVDLPFKEGSFDAVVANSIFEHLTLELAEATISGVRDVLKAGGLFFGCFDKVGGGPGEYYELQDGTHVYTDKGRKGMLLRYFTDEELRKLFARWTITSFETLPSGSRILWAHT